MKIFLIMLSLMFLSIAPLAIAGEGHDAGREWAEDNDITDPDDCDGNSDSFIEGCQEYAEEQEEEEE